MSNEDLLDSLLSVASEELEKLDSANKKNRVLKDVDIFSSKIESSPNETESGKIVVSNSLHTGDTDSSDDEDNRYYEERKYSGCGKEIKRLLETKNSEISSSFYGQPKQRVSSWNKIVAGSSSSSNHPTNNPTKGVLMEGFVGIPKDVNQKYLDVFIDPIFGMRITKPLISSQLLKEKMSGREAVPFSKITMHIKLSRQEKDWVICGVLANKSPVKISQKGSQFSIWTITDLKDDIKTISLFLFSSAHKEFWKSSIGTVVGILNPNILDRKEGSKDVACLSVDNSQKIMVFGESKDFGTCKSKKKNGEQCNSIVNLNRCEFCLYHIKQEYQKCSKRSELQANFAGKGLTALRNKVLGKNEVFYAGKSYMAIPAKKSKKLEQKEQDLINRLNGQTTTPIKQTPKKKQIARQLETSYVQRKRDLNILEKLGGSSEKSLFSNIHSPCLASEESKNNAISIINTLKNKQQEPVLKINNKFDLKGDLIVNVDGKKSFEGKISESPSLEESKSTALSVIARLKAKNVDNEMTKNSITKSTNELAGPSEVFQRSSSVEIERCKEHSISSASSTTKLQLPFMKPTLSGFDDKIIDLNKPVEPHHIYRTKMTAIKLIQKNGPIKKADPNSTKSTNKKRILDQTEKSENVAKKTKLEENGHLSERFKKILAATSNHTDLIEAYDNEEKEKYFNKLEVKERMEEKMTTTYKVPCKAVSCLKCKYTSFSASELCKAEKHPLKVFDALKRFFKCGNCQNRTVSLDIIPTKSCNNCGCSKWERTGMAKEKLVTLTNPLSIRGGEQKFINSVATNMNLDLLVTEEEA